MGSCLSKARFTERTPSVRASSTCYVTVLSLHYFRMSGFTSTGLRSDLFTMAHHCPQREPRTIMPPHLLLTPILNSEHPYGLRTSLGASYFHRLYTTQGHPSANNKFYRPVFLSSLYAMRPRTQLPCSDLNRTELFVCARWL